MQSTPFWVTILTLFFSLASIGIAITTLYLTHFRKKVSAFGMPEGISTKRVDGLLEGVATVVVANDGNQPLLIDNCRLIGYCERNKQRTKKGKIIWTTFRTYDLSSESILNPNEIRKYHFDVDNDDFASDEEIHLRFNFHCVSTNKKYMSLNIDANVLLNPAGAKNKSFENYSDLISTITS